MLMLDANSTGKYLVETKSGSSYIIDLDERTLLRVVTENSDTVLIPTGEPVLDYGTHNGEQSRLRGDNQEPVTLVNILSCTVGESAAFMLNGVADSPEIMTLRQTTPVIAITPIDDTP